MTALQSHRAMAPGRERDGLTGDTEECRREIEARIGRVSALKARVEGRPLTPFEIALALGLDRDDSPRKKCTSCLSWLPATSEHFHRLGHRLHSKCKPCLSRYNARYATRKRSEGARDKKRERQQAYYRRRKESGVPRRPRTTLQRLRDARGHAARRLAASSDPGRRARLAAHIENLTHEIDRMARSADR